MAWSTVPLALRDALRTMRPMECREWCCWKRSAGSTVDTLWPEALVAQRMT
jgi:hypothetical protein